MANDLFQLSALDLGSAVRGGDISAVESVNAALARIEQHNAELGAFGLVCGERALAEARAMESVIAAGDDPGPLAGVPLGVKDLEDVAGLPTTFGSVPFRDFVADVDSVHVARLRAAGAIVVGKTNTPEFGYTAFTRNRVFGTARNPWNLERTPGGSSGGSAAAVAGRLVPLATASDGGGSIRIPACYVGAFGFKPTFGRVPIGPEQLGLLRWVDTVHYGPLTRTVADGALYLDVTCGYHPCDPTSLPRPARSYLSQLDEAPAPLRVGFSRDLGYALVQRDVMREVEEAVGVFRGLGHQVEDVDEAFPDLGRAWAYLSGAETWAEVQPFVAGREGELGRSFWAGLEAASTVTVEQVARFQRERLRLNEVLERLFGRYDLLLTPAMPTEAFAATGPLPSGADGEEFTSPIHAVAFTFPFNLSGHPAATVRAGFTDAGLPAGLQMVAERHRDDLVLQAARAYERERPFDRWPQLES